MNTIARIIGFVALTSFIWGMSTIFAQSADCVTQEVAQAAHPDVHLYYRKRLPDHVGKRCWYAPGQTATSRTQTKHKTAKREITTDRRSVASVPAPKMVPTTVTAHEVPIVVSQEPRTVASKRLTAALVDEHSVLNRALARGGLDAVIAWYWSRDYTSPCRLTVPDERPVWIPGYEGEVLVYNCASYNDHLRVVMRGE